MDDTWGGVGAKEWGGGGGYVGVNRRPSGGQVHMPEPLI